jgi:hypothetical protein
MAEKEFKLTKLSPEEEEKFQTWIKSLPWHNEYIATYGEEPDLNTPMYDYRGAWKAGEEPQRNPNDQNMYHWSSKFKSPEHPTMWKEEFMKKFGFDPDSKGITKDKWLELKNKPPIGIKQKLWDDYDG